MLTVSVPCRQALWGMLVHLRRTSVVSNVRSASGDLPDPLKTGTTPLGRLPAAPVHLRQPSSTCCTPRGLHYTSTCSTL
jgi:hypothetical protein